MWNGIFFFSSRSMQVFVRILIQNVAWNQNLQNFERNHTKMILIWVLNRNTEKWTKKRLFFFEFFLELRSIKIGFTFTWNPSLYLVVCSICKNFNNVEHPGNWMIAMWRISAFRIILMWQQWKATSLRLLAIPKKNTEKKIFVRYIFRLGSGIYKVFFSPNRRTNFLFLLCYFPSVEVHQPRKIYTFQSFSIQHSNLQSYHFVSDVILHQLHSHFARSSRAFCVRYESGRDSKKLYHTKMKPNDSKENNEKI